MFLKYGKPIVDFDTPEPEDNEDEKTAHPMIVPPEIWQKIVINFDQILRKKKRACPRVACYGSVVFFDSKSRVVALASLRDLSEKSGGFEIAIANLELEMSVNDILYLEFLDPSDLVLNHVKVVLKRIQPMGPKTKVGVEFVGATPGFQDKLESFLTAKRNEMGIFDDIETI